MIMLLDPMKRSAPLKLTAYTNLALRTLQYAALKDPELTRIDDVIAAHDLKRANIMKVVFELGREGYLETVRGRGGGFRLSKRPDQINVGDIVRFTEGPMDIVECFAPDTNTCPLIGICVLSKNLRKAHAAFMEVLDGLTIADIAANKKDLNKRLILSQAGTNAA